MTLRKWLFDVEPAGTTLTTANVRSIPDNAAPSTVGASAGTGTVVSTATAHIGLAAQFTANASSTVIMRTPFATATTAGAVSFYHDADTTPALSGGGTAAARIANVRCTSGGVSIDLRADGTIVLANGSTSSTSASGIWTATTRHRFSLTFTVGGACTLKVYVGDSTSAIATISVASGTTSGTAGSVDFGVIAGVLTSTWVTRLDSVQMEDASTTELGPYIEVNEPPQVTAGPTQNVASGAAVTLAFGVSDVDGTVTTRATTFDHPTTGAPSITGGTGNAPTFTAGAAGSLYIARHTATDNDGAEGVGITEVRVPRPGAAAVAPLPMAATKVGTWTRVGSATTDGAALADSSTASYLESGAVSSTPQTAEVRLEPSDARAAGAFTLQLSTGSDGGTVTATVRLVEGVTVRQTWTQTVNTTSATDFTFTMSAGTVSAIGDWGNLRVRIEFTS